MMKFQRWLFSVVLLSIIVPVCGALLFALADVVAWPVVHAQRETVVSSVSSYQELNNITNAAAQTFTATDPAIVDLFANVETASVRWRCDGTAPTATVGHLVAAGGTIVLHGHENIRRLSIIATTATNANVHGSLARP